MRQLTRSSVLTFALLLLGLCSCSQDPPHPGNVSRRIPIDARRWYQLNNPVSGLDELFDGRTQQNVHTGYGTILSNYDAYYPLLQGEQMTIDSIAMFDWEGTFPDRPMTIYAITADWKRTPIAVFTGMRYNGWDGPDPQQPDVLALKTPISGIRGLVINTWGNFPSEIEFYGTYTHPDPTPPAQLQHNPLANFFGVNAFEWDFLDQTDHSHTDPVRLAAIDNFTGIRHYMDWEKLELTEGVYSFAPTTSGEWNYDTIYHWCAAQGIEVLACLKTLPPWLVATYPKDQQDNENTPMRYGRNPADPASYLEQARAGFQYAARYGCNKDVPASLIHLPPSNTLRTGLGYIHYIECDNERDKWWKGRKAYQTGREYAANLSAFYDGNKHTMGPGAGVKTADPSMKVVMAGTASVSTDFVRGIIDWSREFRGLRPDGSIDLPFDVINYHYYSNDADYVLNRKQTTGVAPELSGAERVARNFVTMSHTYAQDLPVWVTEAGYDLNRKSPQKAIPIGSKSAQQTQADWMLRTSLLYSRAGIARVFYYELMDDNPASDANFSTCGLVNADRSPRPVANYFREVDRRFGQYTYDTTLSTDPIVDRYTHGDSVMYVLAVPDEKGRTASYTLNVGNAPVAYIHTPGSNTMNVTTLRATNGKVNVTVTETPVFVTVAP
jgi:endoglucanase